MASVVEGSMIHRSTVNESTLRFESFRMDYTSVGSPYANRHGPRGHQRQQSVYDSRLAVVSNESRIVVNVSNFVVQCRRRGRGFAFEPCKVTV